MEHIKNQNKIDQNQNLQFETNSSQNNLAKADDIQNKFDIGFQLQNKKQYDQKIIDEIISQFQFFSSRKLRTNGFQESQIKNAEEIFLNQMNEDIKQQINFSLKKQIRALSYLLPLTTVAAISLYTRTKQKSFYQLHQRYFKSFFLFGSLLHLKNATQSTYQKKLLIDKFYNEKIEIINNKGLTLNNKNILNQKVDNVEIQNNLQSQNDKPIEFQQKDVMNFDTLQEKQLTEKEKFDEFSQL